MLPEIVHRFMLRHRNLPHATLPDTNGNPASAEICTAALACDRKCCKRNVEALLDYAAGTPSPAKAYSQIMCTLDVELPGSTIPAEKMNAEQRFNSMGAYDRRPTGFARQASAHVSVHSKNNGTIVEAQSLLLSDLEANLILPWPPGDRRTGERWE